MHTPFHFITAAAILLVLAGPVVQSASINARGAGTQKHRHLSHYSGQIKARHGNTNMEIKVHNNFSGDQGIFAYVTGQSEPGVHVILDHHSTQWYDLRSTNRSSQPVPVGEGFEIPCAQNGSTTIPLPGYLTSGRIYISEGPLTFGTIHGSMNEVNFVEPSVSNPADANANTRFGFIEFTNEDGVFISNLSYVDWVGLVLGLSLTLSNQTTIPDPQIGHYGLKANATAQICEALENHASYSDAPWEQLCVRNASNQQLLRVISPNQLAATGITWPLTYWDDYIDKVWETYKTKKLNINTQDEGGTKVDQGVMIECQVNDEDMLDCPGTGHQYPKPTSQDVWSCSGGPFSNTDTSNYNHTETLARLAAAFVRSTLLLPEGNIQPKVNSSSYYPVDPSIPTNHYSRIIHEHLLTSQGYAFPYDDVSPAGEDAAGLVKWNAGGPTDPTVAAMEIFVDN
ncbi:hypothetical protein F4779DRAFT_199552 [Xylariaceae sp. FL0662B]|nr:hypothetical protein F4779DRAFT_199552 [Xylariaceae sp. FL0662B]